MQKKKKKKRQLMKIIDNWFSSYTNIANKALHIVKRLKFPGGNRLGVQIKT